MPTSAAATTLEAAPSFRRKPRKPHKGNVFPRESLKARKARTLLLLKRLHEAYPEAKCELEHHDPFQLLVATILSAQCTDKRVNMTTPELFRRYPTPHDLAAAPPETIADLIKPTGFFNNKTKSIQGAARMLEEKFDSTVPKTMLELLRLPGVARKTANVVLGTGYGLNVGRCGGHPRRPHRPAVGPDKRGGPGEG